MATERKQELGALLQPCYSSIQVTRKEKLFSHPCISSVLLMFYPIHIENSLQFMSDISLWIFVSYPLFITDSVMNTLPPMLWYSTHHLLSLFQERYTAATAACWTITVTDIWKRWYKTYIQIRSCLTQCSFAFWIIFTFLFAIISGNRIVSVLLICLVCAILKISSWNSLNNHFILREGETTSLGYKFRLTVPALGQDSIYIINIASHLHFFFQNLKILS